MNYKKALFLVVFSSIVVGCGNSKSDAALSSTINQEESSSVVSVEKTPQQVFEE